MVSSTGLTGYRHVVKLCITSGTAGNNVFHGTGEQCGSGILNHGLSLFITFQKNIAVMVKDLGIKSWRVVYAAVSNCCKCSAELIVIYTVSQTTKCDGFYFVRILQGGDSEILSILISQCRCYFVNCLNSAYIL